MKKLLFIIAFLSITSTCFAEYYLTGYTSEDAAEQRSSEIAIDRGCNGTTTKYWFSWIKHPNRNEWALQINTGQENCLRGEERALLKSAEILKSDNWF